MKSGGGSEGNAAAPDEVWGGDVVADVECCGRSGRKFDASEFFDFSYTDVRSPLRVSIYKRGRLLLLILFFLNTFFEVYFEARE